MKHHNICIRKYTLPFPKTLGEGTARIIFLTDIHNKAVGEEREALLQCIEQCNPDVVLIGGDVLIGKPNAEIETAVRFIEELSERYRVWYANGNHEQRIYERPDVYGDMGLRYEEEIKKTKAIRLRNQRADFEINQIPFSVYGLNGEATFYRKGLFRKEGMLEELQEYFGKRPVEERFSILLAHNPRYGKEYLKWGANVTLSGHYHGGVMLFGKHIGLASPDFRMFSRWCCGMRKKGNATMIVSAGAGEHTLPIRIHNPREVTFLEFVPEEV